MRALVDTHVLLWWVQEFERLSERAREAMRSDSSELFFSVASAWEVVIKVGRGSLVLAEPPAEYLSRQLAVNEIATLGIRIEHVWGVHQLPHHHRDPFDRMLVAQARAESMSIITGDPLIAQYEVPVIW